SRCFAVVSGTLKVEPRTTFEDSEPASATGEPQLTRRSKSMRTLTTALILSTLLLPLSVAAQTPAPAPAPAPAAAPPPAEAPPAATPEAPKKKGGGPSLGLSPEAPQAGGRLVSPAEPAPVVAAEPSTEWKFDVTGYFR